MKSFFLVTALLAASAHAQCLDAINTAKLDKSIRQHMRSYGDDVPKPACAAPKTPAEKLICTHRTLNRMAWLDRMAYVYAYENATKTETDHNTTIDADYWKALQGKVDTAEKLCRAFVAHTNDSLGGESPYYRP